MKTNYINRQQRLAQLYERDEEINKVLYGNPTVDEMLTLGDEKLKIHEELIELESEYLKEL